MAGTGTFVSHIDPQQHNKLNKLVGNCCLLRFDSGAQVSILPKRWLAQYEPKLTVRDVSELLNGGKT